MRYLFLIYFVFIISSSYAQEWVDAGVSLGASFYSGDINDSELFYSPGFSKGFLYKVNVNDRYAVKLIVSNSKIKGNDADFNNEYQITRNESFQTNVWDVGLQTEFNFLPYDLLEVGTAPFSPYAMFGIGGIYISSLGKQILSIPVGVGFKYNIYGRIGIGCEYSFRKTFNDEIDGVTDVSSKSKHSLIHNNDWISFINFIATYNISKIRISCPAYD